MKNIPIRISMYLGGLFILTLGIALSVKSDLGVSPLSSLPYTVTCVWGVEMGKATIIFHCGLVLLQILLLRKNFNPKNFLQIIAGIIFGYFTTFCNYLFSFVSTPNSMTVKIILAIVSTSLTAIGIFLYLPANIIPLAGEGIIEATSKVTKIDFSITKITFDFINVIISLIICFVTLHTFASVGIGTLLAALLVGVQHGWLVKLLGKQRDKLLNN